MSYKENEWLKDFEVFVTAAEESLPPKSFEKLKSRVASDLHPSAWLVFFKVLGVHSLMGVFSLSICDQFGMSPFDSGISLSDYFMKFGHSFCMVLCGFLFLFVSIVSALVLLKREERRVFRQNCLIQIFSLTVLSLATFIFLGTEMALAIGFFWFLGAFAGGSLPLLFVPRPKVVASKMN